MKTFINSGELLTRDEMKNILGGIGPIGEKCGTETCSIYQACCSDTNASGETIYHCTTAACL